jgi:1-acyl-sn-glycerol-3-phosphate acyltransferase
MNDTLFYRLVRWTSIPLFKLYFSLRRAGSEQVPANGPVIVAGNHASYLDPAVLGSAFPRPIHFLINARVWRATGMNWFYRGMRSIPVDRDGRPTRDAIQAALHRLGQGRVVGIFPEGGRNGAGGVEEALAGVALLARKSGALVVPAGLAGTADAMPIGKALPEPVPIRVHFGEPLRVEPPAGRGPAARRSADRRFTVELMERIAGLVRKAEAERLASSGVQEVS